MDILPLISILLKKPCIKTGEYFLVGHGGPMSSYAESCAGQSCSGTIFNPFTEEDAKKWAMDRLDADAYIALFGEVEE